MPKVRSPLRLCALTVLGLGLLLPAGAAQATATGTVVAWGCGDFANWGQCSVPDGLSGVTAISAGTYHSLALKDDGTVVAWGCSGADFGQCSVPDGLSGVTAISAGAWHSLALKADGTVVAWGCNVFYTDWGQCATGGLSGATAVAAGTYHSLALKSDGTVVAWGCGTGQGQCDVPPGLSGVTAISAGAYDSLALKDNGTVVAWGCALEGVDSGQCDVQSGLAGVIAIAAGPAHSLAVKGHGAVVAWGCGGVFPTDFGQCSVPSGLAGAIAVAAGSVHSLALVGPPAPNQPPDCSGVTAAPDSIWPQTRDKLATITLSGATDPEADTLAYHIDGVTQDEPVSGVGDDTSPDAVLTPAGASSDQVLVRAEANSHLNGRVYRIAYTVSDGYGGTCSGTAGPSGDTTARVGVQRKKEAPAIDDGSSASWNSFTGAPVP